MADIRNQAPQQTKASAGVKGAGDGMKLAISFIKDAEENAASAVKTGESMKAKLTKLTKLVKEEHNAFTKAMNDKREEIKVQAKNAGAKDLQSFFTSGSRDGQMAAYIQSSVSMWIKMSVACFHGYRPDLNKPWAVLSKEATDYKAAAKATPQKPLTAAEKAIAEAQEQQRMVKGAVQQAVKGLVEGEGDAMKLKPQAASALPDVVAGIVQLASVEELDAVIARLTDMRTAKVQAREEAAKAIAGASAKSTAKRDKKKDKETLDSSVKPGNVGRNADDLIATAKEITAPQGRGRGRTSEKAKA